MAITDLKLKDSDITEKGVVAAPTILNGTPEENKKIFDRLIREVFKGDFNALIDALAADGGADEIGAAVAGLTGGTVQEVLTALKTYIDQQESEAAQQAAASAQEAAAAKNAAQTAANSAAYYAGAASTKANDAAASKTDAEAWAVGQRDGVDVGETDPAYQNNAKYYAEHSGGSGSGGYTVLGIYPSIDALRQAHPVGEAGDAWRVGTTDDNTTYVWDVDAEDWVDIGTGGSGVSQDELDAKQDKITANGFLKGDGSGGVTAESPVYIVPVSVTGDTATITSEDTYADLYEKLTAGYTVMLREWGSHASTDQTTELDAYLYLCDNYDRLTIPVPGGPGVVKYGFSFFHLTTDGVSYWTTLMSSDAVTNAGQKTFTRHRQQYGAKPTLTPYTLAAADWASTDKTQVLDVDGVGDDEGAQVIIVAPATASTENQRVYYESGVRCIGQQIGQLNFQCDTIPDVDISIYISVQEAQS